jgi:nucleoid DNA-binding protein
MLTKQQSAAGKHSRQGQHWQPPWRQSANQSGSKGRDWLALELQRKGLTFRKARAAVTALFASMREGLRRDKWVETPIGEFEVRSRAQPLERKRFGRKQYLYLQPTVVFKPHPELLGDNRKGHQK